MKFLISILFILISLHADEMQRIENIVNDIAKLRVDYEECTTALKQQNKESVPFKAIEYKSEESSEKDNNNDKLLKSEIASLQLLLKAQEETIKAQESKIKELELKKISSEKVVVTKEVQSPKVVCKEAKDTNVFPKLAMKENLVVKEQERSSGADESIKEVEAGVFRLNSDSTIYDSINGNKIEQWEVERSFTSNIQSENWIKITGYFTDKKWHPSEKEMWIMLKKVTKR